jgi:ATP-dependent DNA ligase
VITLYATDHATALDWMETLTSIGTEGIVSKRLYSHYGAPRAWSQTKYRETLAGIIAPLHQPEALIIGRGSDAATSSMTASIRERSSGHRI